MTITTTAVTTMMSNIMAAFFDDTSTNPAGRPRIVPGNQASTIWGTRDNTAVMGPWWMMADMLRLMVEYSRAFPNDASMRTRIEEQAAYLTGGYYSEAQLQSDGANDGTIVASDDAGWKMQSLCDLHRITKDPAWLNRARIALPKCLNRFKDPNHLPQMDGGDGVLWSPFGITYTEAGAYSNISSSIETGMVQAALYIYEQTGVQGFLNYATGMATRWIKPGSGSDAGFLGIGPNQGAYFVELILDATPVQPYFRVPACLRTEPDGTQPPFRNGGSTYMIQASMGVGIVCAKLYRITGNATWLTPIQQIIAALSSASVYLTNVGKFLNDRDPFSVGFFACDFVREVLSLHAEGIDADNAVRNAFVTTGQYILDHPVQGTDDPAHLYYSADWGVPGDDVRNGLNSTGYSSWTAQGSAMKGIQDTPQAYPEQIMTTSMAGMMAMAGYLCGTLTGATLTDGGNVLTDGGHTLTDA